MSSSLKSSKGFTLVEVIVVAVIVAILAAVAVPLYLNYIKTSRNQVASNTAGSIATFCASCENGGGSSDIPTAEKSGFTITCTGGSGDGTTLKVPTNLKVVSTDTKSPAIISVTFDDPNAVTQTVSW